MSDQDTRISGVTAGSPRGLALSMDRRQAGFVSVGVTLVVLASVSAFALGQGTTNQLLRLLQGHLWLANSANGTVSLVNGSNGNVDAVGKVVLDGATMSRAIDINGSIIVLDSQNRAHLIDAAKGFKEQSVMAADGFDLLPGTNRVWEARYATGQGQARLPISQGMQAVGSSQTAGGAVSVAAAVVADDDSLVMASKSRGNVTTMTPDGSSAGHSFSPGNTVKLTTVRGKPVLLDLKSSKATPLAGGMSAVSFKSVVDVEDSVPVAGCDTCDNVVLTDGNAIVTMDLDANPRPSERIDVGFPVKQVVVRDGDVFLSSEQNYAFRIDLNDPKHVATPVVLPDQTQVQTDDLQIRAGDVYLNNRASDTAASIAKGSTTARPVQKYTQPQVSAAEADLTDTTTAPQGPATGKQDSGKPTPPTTPVGQPGGVKSGKGGGGGGKPRSGVPSVPRLTLVPSDRAIELRWTGAKPNGAPIMGYTATERGPEDAVARPLPELGANLRSSMRLDLTNGAIYCYTVYARNNVGSGAATAEVCAKPTSAFVEAPVSVDRAEPSDGQIDVAWTAGDGGRGDPVTGWRLKATPVGGGAATTVDIAEPAANKATLIDLSNNDKFTVTVQALSSSTGQEIASVAIEFPSTVQPFGVPGRPNATVSGGGTSKTLKVSGGGANGRLIDWYQWKEAGDPDSSYKNFRKTAGSDVLGFEGGRAFQLKVRVLDSEGQTSESSTVDVSTPSPNLTVRFGADLSIGKCTSLCRAVEFDVRNFKPNTMYAISYSTDCAAPLTQTKCLDGSPNGDNYKSLSVTTDANGSADIRNPAGGAFGFVGSSVWLTTTSTMGANVRSNTITR